MFRFRFVLAHILTPCLLLTITVLLAGCDQTSAPQTQAVPASSTAAIHLYINDDRIMPNLSYLCRGSAQLAPPLAAIVTVDQHLPGHWTTPNGLRPANVTNQSVLATGYTIVTPLHFSHMSALWDKRTNTTNEFITQGGQAGQDQILVEDDNQLELNKSYLVFFKYTLLPHQNVRNHAQLYVASSYLMKTPQVVIVQQKAIEQGQVTQQEKTVPLDYIKQLFAQCAGKPVEQ